MASTLISLSFSTADAELRAFIESVASDPDNLVGGDIKACLKDYMGLCRTIEQHDLDVLIANASHVKADKSARGHTWVLLAKDTDGE